MLCPWTPEKQIEILNPFSHRDRPAPSLSHSEFCITQSFKRRLIQQFTLTTKWRWFQQQMCSKIIKTKTDHKKQDFIRFSWVTARAYCEDSHTKKKKKKTTELHLSSCITGWNAVFYFLTYTQQRLERRIRQRHFTKVVNLYVHDFHLRQLPRSQFSTLLCCHQLCVN